MQLEDKPIYALKFDPEHPRHGESFPRLEMVQRLIGAIQELATVFHDAGSKPMDRALITQLLQDCFDSWSYPFLDQLIGELMRKDWKLADRVRPLVGTVVREMTPDQALTYFRDINDAYGLGLVISLSGKAVKNPSIAHSSAQTQPQQWDYCDAEHWEGQEAS